MKFVILVLTLATAALAQININTPDCNFQVSVTTPSTNCCCPTTTVAPTATTTIIPPSFIQYCCEIVTYNYPTCRSRSDEMFPHVNDCNKYYICDGANIRLERTCPTGSKFSGILRKCIPTSCPNCVL